MCIRDSERKAGRGKAPEDRIKNWNEFHASLSEEEQRRQGARCMDCGVPFCQSGMMLSLIHILAKQYRISRFKIYTVEELLRLIHKKAGAAALKAMIPIPVSYTHLDVYKRQVV